MVERNCPVCSTLYLADPARLKHGRQTTCSRECSYSLRGQQKANLEAKSCPVCGTLVSRSPSQQKAASGNFFCSRSCHYKGRTLGLVKRVVTKPYHIPTETRQASSERRKTMNYRRKSLGLYGHTEETKRKLSLTTSKAIALGRIPRVSQLEKDVGVVLERLFPSIKAQHGIRDARGAFQAVVDFYLPDQKVVVEVNGTFWHADPRVYPQGPVHFSQIRTCSRYARKQAYLKQQGLTLVEVWELDFKTRGETAIRETMAPWLTQQV